MKIISFKAWYTSIFVRIYAGLIGVSVIAGVVAFFLLQGITNYRIQHYKEDMASGVAKIIADGLARQQDAVKRQNWLNDARAILNLPIVIKAYDPQTLSSRENARLRAGLAVVLADRMPRQTTVMAKLADSAEIISVDLAPDSIREQQIKALPVFLLDDLMAHRENVPQRLAQIQRYFSFPITFMPLVQANLDDDQRARIKRKEIVLIFRENSNHGNSSIWLISPTPQEDQVLVLGAIGLFTWLPYQIIIAISAIALSIVFIGVYGLIFPLHRKILSMQQAVSRVREGDFNTRVNVKGSDEIATLGYNFNNMTDHIQRLIGAQQELTRAVSHELRTPVARIRFGLEMLAETDDQASRWQQLGQIDKDIETLNELIDEILTYAKLEQGTPALNMTRVSLGKLVGQVQEETNALGAKAIDVQIAVGKRNITAIADYKYLHRVLQNLAGNAVRYANSAILIRAGVKDNIAFISVEDDGPGIPEAEYDKIFIPFARLDDSRTRASGGYGLGLSIAARIAFWFDGKMVVDKSPTLGGARFIMTWPARIK